MGLQLITFADAAGSRAGVLLDGGCVLDLGAAMPPARRPCAATTQMSRRKPSNFRIDTFIFSNAYFILLLWISGLTSAENCVILRSFPPETVIFDERRRRWRIKATRM